MSLEGRSFKLGPNEVTEEQGVTRTPKGLGVKSGGVSSERKCGQAEEEGKGSGGSR